MTNTKEVNISLFEDMPVAKAVRTMAVPTIIGQLIVLIYSMADTFFVGRTNNPNMVAATSLVLPIFKKSSGNSRLFKCRDESVPFVYAININCIKH